MFFKLLISLDDGINAGQYEFAGLMVSVVALRLVQLLDHGHDLLEGDRLVLLAVVHELPQLLFFGYVDDEPVAVFEVEVDVLGELSMGKKGVTNF